MIRIFKNNVLNIFIVVVFFLSQAVSVNANQSKNNDPKESIAVSIMEKGKEKAVNIAALFVTDISHGAKNDVTVEGKIEKVFNPITLGIITTEGAIALGALTGFSASIFSTAIGWIIGKTKSK